MIFEFFVDNNIYRKNSNIVDSNLEYFKCKFYLNTEVWGNSNIFVTFTNDYGYIETLGLGKASKIVTCLIPQKFIEYNEIFLYLHADEKVTNSIAVDLTKKSKIKKHHPKEHPRPHIPDHHQIRPKKKCNPIIDIFEQVDQKIDNIIYEDCQLKCYSNGHLIDTIYLHNIDEESSLYLKEDIENKTTEISEESTNDEYPTAKAVYEYINNIIGQTEHDI